MVGSSIIVMMLQLLGLPSLLLSTWLFVTNLEAAVLYAQVLALVAVVTWSAGTSLLGALANFYKFSEEAFK